MFYASLPCIDSVIGDFILATPCGGLKLWMVKLALEHWTYLDPKQLNPSYVLYVSIFG